MRAQRAKVVIATRRSRLALWQAEHVKERLQALRRGLEVELLPLSTRGDELVDVSLAKVGGKGDRKSTRLNSSHIQKSRMPSSA